MENSIKVTLIQPAGIEPAGLGIISSYLKKEGHKVNFILLRKGHDFSSTCSNEIFDDLYFLCKDSDLIGFSVMTNLFIYVTDLTRRLKEKTDIPIIYGGIHPTVKPMECLEHADMICLGEGEEAMLELSNKLESQDITDITAVRLK